jgi:hypothetical protein
MAVRLNNGGSAEVVGECQVGQEGRARQEEEGGGGRRKETRGIGERRRQEVEAATEGTRSNGSRAS